MSFELKRERKRKVKEIEEKERVRKKIKAHTKTLHITQHKTGILWSVPSIGDNISLVLLKTMWKLFFSLENLFFRSMCFEMHLFEKKSCIYFIFLGN
jgi:hypothetical protein